MKKIRFQYMFIAAVMVVTLGACQKSDSGSDEGIEIRSVDTRMVSRVNGSVVEVITKAINQTDPTMTPPDSRTGQILAITIGAKTRNYILNSGKWVPEGMALSFPGYVAADVSYKLTSAGADPISAQDGQIEKLIAADALEGKVEGQEPTTELQAQLVHTNALIDFEIDGITAVDLNTASIKINAAITPCRVPADGTKYQVIVAAGTPSVRIVITYSGNEYTADVITPSGSFDKNTRYKFKVKVSGGAIVSVENITVDSWAEAGGGVGSAKPQ